jgi:maltose phosphorylase
MEFPSDHKRIIEKTKLAESELKKWKKVADNMYFQYLKTWDILATRWLLDKDLVPVKIWMQDQLTKKWSWDRVLRSPSNKLMCLQCFYFFEEHFSKEELKRNFNFMNPLLCMKAPFLHVYIPYKLLH